jgi:A/G-specific adenine glycosylase
MANFQEEIINWYLINKRDLPWRNTQDPYKIWLSEIILQQTRVQQGLPYYLKFLNAFPTINDFAQASEQEVLSLWQGLGYYSRARNMRKAAMQIMESFNGEFPKTEKQLLSLSGVGKYSAAAIGSFSFKLPLAVVDGNVYRVLSRVFNMDTPIDTPQGQRAFQELASTLLPKLLPDTYNQAIMEFGALQCTPKSPDCPNCVLSAICMGRIEKNIDVLPVKIKSIKTRNRFFAYQVFINDENRTIVQERGPKDIWQGLFEFPLMEFESEELTMNFINGEAAKISAVSNVIKHKLTHQLIFAYFIVYRKSDLPIDLKPNQNRIPFSNIDSFPMSRLMVKFLESVNPILFA